MEQFSPTVKKPSGYVALQSEIDKELRDTHVRQFAGLFIIPDSWVHGFVYDWLKREGEKAVQLQHALPRPTDGHHCKKATWHFFFCCCC